MCVVNAGIDDGDGGPFTPDSLGMEPVDASEAVCGVVRRPLLQRLGRLLGYGSYGDGPHGLDIRNAGHSAEGVGIARIRLEDQAREDVTAIKLLGVPQVGTGVAVEFLGHAGSAQSLRAINSCQTPRTADR